MAFMLRKKKMSAMECHNHKFTNTLAWLMMRYRMRKRGNVKQKMILMMKNQCLMMRAVLPGVKMNIWKNWMSLILYALISFLGQCLSNNFRTLRWSSMKVIYTTSRLLSQSIHPHLKINRNSIKHLQIIYVCQGKQGKYPQDSASFLMSGMRMDTQLPKTYHTDRDTEPKIYPFLTTSGIPGRSYGDKHSLSLMPYDISLHKIIPITCRQRILHRSLHVLSMSIAEYLQHQSK